MFNYLDINSTPKDWEIIIVFQPYSRDGSRFRLLCRDSTFNQTFSGGQYGFGLIKELKDHFETINKLTESESLKTRIKSLLNSDIELSKHVSTCQSWYGNSNPRVDTKEYIRLLNNEYNQQLDEELSLTSVLIY